MCHYDGVNDNSVAVDECANGSEVDLGVGQTLQVRLPENRVTGYRWVLEEAGAPACALIGDTYQASDEALGQGGDHEWRFQATQSGVGTIRFAYGRPWEQGKSAARTFTLRVRVNPG